MLKNLIKKCALILNRDDISNCISKCDSVENIEDNQIKNDTLRLISYYNFISKSLAENYLENKIIEHLSSDNEGKINFFQFGFVPLKIFNVFDENNYNLKFIQFPEYIQIKNYNSTVKICYSYLPDEIIDLNEKVSTINKQNEKIILYGMVSEFFASKNQFDKSEFWKNKFFYEIFKLKTKKERRLKSTFCK